MRKMFKRRGFTLAEVLRDGQRSSRCGAVMVPAVINQVGKGDFLLLTGSPEFARDYDLCSDTRQFPGKLSDLWRIDSRGWGMTSRTRRIAAMHQPLQRAICVHVTSGHIGPTVRFFADSARHSRRHEPFGLHEGQSLRGTTARAISARRRLHKSKRRSTKHHRVVWHHRCPTSTGSVFGQIRRYPAQ